MEIQHCISRKTLNNLQFNSISLYSLNKNKEIQPPSTSPLHKTFLSKKISAHSNNSLKLPNINIIMPSIKFITTIDDNNLFLKSIKLVSNNSSTFSKINCPKYIQTKELENTPSSSQKKLFIHKSDIISKSITYIPYKIKENYELNNFKNSKITKF